MIEENKATEEVQTRRGRQPKEAVSEPVIAGLSGKMVTINIPASDQNNKSVAGSINTIQFNIPRGKPVEVPVEVYNVLNDANIVSISGDGKPLGAANRFNAQLVAA